MRPSASTAIGAAIVALSTPSAALAAEPPTIVSAGIDATDRLYVTWSLGAGTTYNRAVFATGPRPHPHLVGYFADENLSQSNCAGLPGCLGMPAATSFTARRPIERDRRFFVEVTANDGERLLTSAVWVIDETKPLIVEEALAGDPRRPTNDPVGGRWFASPPSASLSLTRLPTTIAGVFASLVRVRARCTVSCDVALRLSLDGRTLAQRSGRLFGGSSTKLVLRPQGLSRATLRERSRARLRITGTVSPLGGPQRRMDRTFVVRR
jgi:hypothetical protein